MKKQISQLLRRPPVLIWAVLQLLIVLGAVWAAAQPAAVYQFSPDQWEVIAQHSEIGYDEDGRRGVTEMTDGEAIMQTPAMSLPAGHYRVTLDYRYKPGLTEEGVEHRANLYFTAAEDMTVSGEQAWVNVDVQQDTVVLNVNYASDTIRLVANNDGGIFTIGHVEVRQDMLYAWACVLGWVVLFCLLDLALLLLVPGSPRALRDADLRGCIWLLAGVTLLACVPLFMNSGGCQGADWRFHLSRIEGIAQGLREGQFPVRIYSQAKDGYGYAPSLFYGELFLYFPAALRLLGMSVQGAYRTYVMVIQALTAGISFFSFRQMFRHNKTALLGSILYMLAPYHIYNIYWRSAVGEYTALAFLPLIPAALTLLYARQTPDKRQARVACAELVVAFGALVQTHIISLELAAIVCAVFGLYHWRRTFTRRVLAVWGAAAGLVVLLNLWFLFPFATLMLGGGYNNMYGGESFAGGLAVPEERAVDLRNAELARRPQQHRRGAGGRCGGLYLVLAHPGEGNAPPGTQDRPVGRAAGRAGLLDGDERLPLGLAGRAARGRAAAAGDPVPVAVFLAGDAAAGGGQRLRGVGAAARPLCAAGGGAAVVGFAAGAGHLLPQLSAHREHRLSGGPRPDDLCRQ